MSKSQKYEPQNDCDIEDDSPKTPERKASGAVARPGSRDSNSRRSESHYASMTSRKSRMSLRGAFTSSSGLGEDVVKRLRSALSKFAVDNPATKFHDFYDVPEQQLLGEGSFGCVSMCVSKSTGAARAVKSIAKSTNAKVTTMNRQEVIILRMLDHPHIIKLYNTFEDPRNFYLITELCEGGDLFDRIEDVGFLTEVQIAIIMQQALDAICYMHEMHLTHRDIKPENFLFLSRQPIEDNTLKLIDFGMASAFSDKRPLTSQLGTTYYVAPEVLAGSYNQAVDLWSCGVVMYLFLVGYPPFGGSTDEAILKRVRKGEVNFKDYDWKDVSGDAMELIWYLLIKDPRERYTAQQALNHTWIKDQAPKAAAARLSPTLVDNLKSFHAGNKMKRAVVQFIVRQCDEAKLQRLKDAFMQTDSDSDGRLSIAELRWGMSKAGLKIPADLGKIMTEADAKGSVDIDYTAFLAAAIERKSYLQEDLCWVAFREFDHDNDGTISAAELEQVIKSKSVKDAMGDLDFQEVLKQADTNGDGVIDFGEFMNMLRSGTLEGVADLVQSSAVAGA